MKRFLRDLETWRPQLNGFGTEVFVVAVAVVVFFLLLSGFPVRSSGYEYGTSYNDSAVNDGTVRDGYTYRDGLWWLGGKSYRAHPKTCWKDERYWVSACCGGGYWSSKRVAYACYEYEPYAYATPETGIEKFAAQLLSIKKAEVQSELKVREDYAFAKQAQELAQSFGVTDYRIQGFGQYLGYGDEYQFPAQQGSTVYGVREYAGDFYGEAAIKLLDADRAIANAYELRKLSREYDHDAELALNDNVAAMDVSRTQQVTALAEMRELRQSVSEGLQELSEYARAMKAEPRASVQVQDHLGGGATHGPYVAPTGDDQSAWSLESLPKWGDVIEQRCAHCHEKHAARKSEIFPQGFDLKDVAKWSARQKIRLWEVIDTGKMPPGDEGPLTMAEKQSLKIWLASQ